MIFADLHVHSRFAQGCSDKITIPKLAKWARTKGVDLLGTGDFTHPEWYEELNEELVDQDGGIFYTEDGFPFVLQTEISLIYTQGRGRKIHLVVLAPSFEVVDEITAYLKEHGRVDYDGRPIFNIPAWRFLKEMKEIHRDIEVIPAHIWTPWFSLFGSKSGFDTLRDCFKEASQEINAIETGISSDVEMNDSLKMLNDVRYVSFSDLHSYWPWRMGREVTLFDLEDLTYENLLRSIRTGEGFAGTIEIPPEYGKYHEDGHRKCDVSMTPSESEEKDNICPACEKKLTIGVQHRVEELSDAPLPSPDDTSQSFYKLLPLHEVISFVKDVGKNTKTVWDIYWNLLDHFENEFEILIEASYEEIKRHSDEGVASAVIAFRKGEYHIRPGYDGVYGELTVEDVENEGGAEQKGLGDF